MIFAGNHINVTATPQLPSEGGGRRNTPTPKEPEQRRTLDTEIQALLDKDRVVRTAGRTGPLFRSSFFLTSNNVLQTNPEPLTTVFIEPNSSMETLPIIRSEVCLPSRTYPSDTSKLARVRLQRKGFQTSRAIVQPFHLAEGIQLSDRRGSYYRETDFKRAVLLCSLFTSQRV